jgi:hypothetical protein
VTQGPGARRTEPAVPASERLIIVFLVGAIQFVNIVDFMMVMPLGPDYANALGISTAHLGLIAGSYTAAAAVAGIIAARFLDRFDRRSALGVRCSASSPARRRGARAGAADRWCSRARSRARSAGPRPRSRCRSSPTSCRRRGAGARWAR